jgi:hypothetical protein
MDEVLRGFGLTKSVKSKIVNDHEKWKELLSLHFFYYVFVLFCCLQVMNSSLHSSWFGQHSTLINLVF